MLIKAYGLYWNPEIVDWGSRGRHQKGTLHGKVKLKTKTHTIDFWKAQGVYVLLAEFKPIYVGKAIKAPLGSRLRTHITDRFAGRWDMFSWFTTSTLNITSKDVRDPGQRQVPAVTVINTLEALGILIADPPLNRKRESLPSAVAADQVKSPGPRSLRSYLEEILENTK